MIKSSTKDKVIRSNRQNKHRETSTAASAMTEVRVEVEEGHLPAATGLPSLPSLPPSRLFSSHHHLLLCFPSLISLSLGLLFRLIHSHTITSNLSSPFFTSPLPFSFTFFFPFYSTPTAFYPSPPTYSFTCSSSCIPTPFLLTLLLLPTPLPHLL